MAKAKETKAPGSIQLKNPKHELFCYLYAGHHNRNLFGNGTRCYEVAYGYDKRELELMDEIEEIREAHEKGYTVEITKREQAVERLLKVCQVESSTLLSKPIIRERCSFLTSKLFSDNYADEELAYTIGQRFDLASKVAAIKEYNRKREGGKAGDGVLEIRWVGPGKAEARTS